MDISAYDISTLPDKIRRSIAIDPLTQCWVYIDPLKSRTELTDLFKKHSIPL